MPLEVIALNDPSVRTTYERPLVLIRPDGHVAWRGDTVPESVSSVSEILDRVRGAK
jgi:FAD-dependent monooxygenase